MGRSTVGRDPIRYQHGAGPGLFQRHDIEQVVTPSGASDADPRLLDGTLPGKSRPPPAQGVRSSTVSVVVSSPGRDSFRRRGSEPGQRGCAPPPWCGQIAGRAGVVAIDEAGRSRCAEPVVEGGNGMSETTRPRLEMPGYDPRDFKGYGRHPPNPQWPGGARIAVQIALNYEAGGERNILHGDAASEDVLADGPFGPYPGLRAPYVESEFEFGSRVGTWRLLRILRERGIPCSFLAVGQAIEANPEIACAAVEDGHEMVGHGYRWFDYQGVPLEEERRYIRQTVDAITRITGTRPVGWMTGRPSMNTRRLLVEEGGFLYDRDSLSDELPYWVSVTGKPHLCVPYSFETNDLRCTAFGDFVTSEDYFTYMKDAFDCLYAEGETQPRMLSLALHDRILGRPARAVGLQRLLDYLQSHERVWFARGDEIARHWIGRFPAPPPATATHG